MELKGLFKSNMHSIEKALSKKAFSFVELMVAIVLMAMAFFPIMELFSNALDQINMTNEISTSMNLAREGMEMIKNKNLSVGRIEAIGDYYYPELKSKPLTLNKRSWRIHTDIHEGTRPLRVDIHVIDTQENKVKLTVSTLFEDLY